LTSDCVYDTMMKSNESLVSLRISGVSHPKQ
jgi:hypothetical protein